MGWCIGILLLIVGFVLFMIPGSQTIGWILWMAGIVCFGGQGFINYKKSSNPTEASGSRSSCSIQTFWQTRFFALQRDRFDI